MQQLARQHFYRLARPFAQTSSPALSLALSALELREAALQARCLCVLLRPSLDPVLCGRKLVLRVLLSRFRSRLHFPPFPAASAARVFATGVLWLFAGYWGSLRREGAASAASSLTPGAADLLTLPSALKLTLCGFPQIQLLSQGQGDGEGAVWGSEKGRKSRRLTTPSPPSPLQNRLTRFPDRLNKVVK
ncbi:hypothetical protein BJY59DRAFT_215742 [Rhodotorula toruloides]